MPEVGFCRVSDAMLIGPPNESNSGPVIGGKPCVAYGQCEKRDQAAAISIGHHAAVRTVGRRLPVESAQSRRDDARARPVRRSFHDSPLSSSWFRCWRKPFVKGSANEASVQSARVGAWTKRISRSTEKIVAGIVPWIDKATPSTSESHTRPILACRAKPTCAERRAGMDDTRYERLEARISALEAEVRVLSR
jgi:hypothetical protein